MMIMHNTLKSSPLQTVEIFNISIHLIVAAPRQVAVSCLCLLSIYGCLFFSCHYEYHGFLIYCV